MKAFCYLLLLIACSVSSVCLAQSHVDLVLKKELDTIIADDQRYRELMAIQPSKQRDSLAIALHIAPDDVPAHYGALQDYLDSLNLQKVEKIFKQYGYPGRSLVDTPTNKAAYYVIQHSAKIEQYFPLIQKAGEQKQLSFALVAMMQDRLLKDQGNEQIYGTQFAGVPIKDSVTHQTMIKWFVWPIKDVQHINQIRKDAGLQGSIEESAAEMGITFQPLTIADVQANYPWLLPAKK